ncbi:DoxX family protein [Niabella hibiscisoli]|uniref:DoxX family protein n=1 Tax=Niabella hibiscisoli TaxID=1825928 RepID=UPI001F0F0A4F|nr:DoxX family protein [Niabella hibiscisoli]MCH5719154.1 DoxX family protein [Niabella hibiscisoli]
MPANTFLLRIAVSTILLMHSVPAILNDTLPHFGAYLDQSGLAPAGIFLAWLIKLSHIAAAICLVIGKWIRSACIVTLLILITGIFMVHLPNGWFVVGGGTNGIEFNLLLIVVLITILFPSGWSRSRLTR